MPFFVNPTQSDANVGLARHAASIASAVPGINHDNGGMCQQRSLRARAITGNMNNLSRQTGSSLRDFFKPQTERNRLHTGRKGG